MVQRLILAVPSNKIGFILHLCKVQGVSYIFVNLGHQKHDLQTKLSV